MISKQSSSTIGLVANIIAAIMADYNATRLLRIR